MFWLNCVSVNYEMSSSSNTGMEMSAPLGNSIVHKWLFHSSPLQSDTASNRSHSALLSDRLVAELYPGFCNQLDWSHGCWQPQIWRDECMVGGFTRLLHMSSRQTLQTKITVYRELGETYLSRYPACWIVQPHSLQYVRTSACHCHVFNQCFMFFQLLQ